MTQIFIDIETCPAQNPAVRDEITKTIEPPGNISKAETIAAWHAEKKPALIEEEWRKTSFDGSCGHICVIGMAIDDYLPVAFYHEDWQANEATILRSFFETVDKACATNPNIQPVFVGHNLINFDLRFIFQRAVVLGVKPSHQIKFDARHVGDRAVFDTMTAWAGFGNRVKLDTLSKALGVGSKGDLDGSKVWDYVSAGRIAEVAEYCRNDVEMTRAIYRRMTFTTPVEEACDVPY
jgi:predicted PolB exonuclease-like 3'-5' exonuclease